MTLGETVSYVQPLTPAKSLALLKYETLDRQDINGYGD